MTVLLFLLILFLFFWILGLAERLSKNEEQIKFLRKKYENLLNRIPSEQLIAKPYVADEPVQQVEEEKEVEEEKPKKTTTKKPAKTTTKKSTTGKSTTKKSTAKSTKKKADDEKKKSTKKTPAPKKAKTEKAEPKEKKPTKRAVSKKVDAKNDAQRAQDEINAMLNSIMPSVEPIKVEEPEDDFLNSLNDLVSKNIDSNDEE